MASSRREDTPLAQPAVAESGYRSGQLFEGREAILRDLQRYLELPFSTFIQSFFHLPTPDECSKMRKALSDDGLLTISDDGEAKWTFLTEPSRSSHHEDAAFEPFGDIITYILHHIPDCRMLFFANPDKTPLSERRNSSRPDAYIQLSPASEKTHWFSIVASFEFKKASTSNAVNDNKIKIIWSLHNVMREDPLRRFAFGFTVEDTKMRLWHSNRAFLAASEPIDIMTDVDEVISLFLSIGAKKEKELGWDPTVERINKDQYKFKVKDEFFTTTRPLATYSADCIVGRGVRVYEAKDQNGRLVAIKDSWRTESRDPEGKILQHLLADIREVLGDEKANEAEKYIVKIRSFEDVADDKTFDPLVEGDLPWITITPGIMHPTSTTSTRKLQLPSVGNIPLSSTGPSIQAKVKYAPVPHRVHTRAVFEEVGETLKDVVCLLDNLQCLSGAQKALDYLHQAGWVHRDLSVNNALWISKDGCCVGKLTDFEYAKKMDSTTSHDVRTGTMDYMAIEVESKCYLFNPRKSKSKAQAKADSDSDSDSDSGSDSLSNYRPPFQMNQLHDLESLWWCTMWILLSKTDLKVPAGDLDVQQDFLQQVFTGQQGSYFRLAFFQKSHTREEVRRVLSKTYRRSCKSIFGLADDLLEAYETLEKDYPVIKSLDSKSLLHELFSDAYQKVTKKLSGKPRIDMQYVSELIKAKAAEDEKRVVEDKKRAAKDKKRAAEDEDEDEDEDEGSKRAAKGKKRAVKVKKKVVEDSGSKPAKKKSRTA